MHDAISLRNRLQRAVLEIKAEIRDERTDATALSFDRLDTGRDLLFNASRK